MKSYKGRNYIDGSWLEPEEHTYPKINPATGKCIGVFPDSGKPVVHDAYVASRKSFEKCKRVSRFVRSDYMYKVSQIIERRREELAKAISWETGKNYN